MYLTETIAASEVSVEAESLWCAIVIDDNRRQIRLDLTWDELPAIADTLTRAYLAHRGQVVGHIDDTPVRRHGEASSADLAATMADRLTAADYDRFGFADLMSREDYEDGIGARLNGDDSPDAA